MLGATALMLGAALTAASPAGAPSPDLAYLTALDAYQQAELAVHQGDLDVARRQLRIALAARDQAIAAWQGTTDGGLQRRVAELTRLDRTCCGRWSLAQRLGERQR